MERIIDPQEIRRTISILKPDNKLFEIRIEGGRNTRSGYFTDADTLIKELEQQDLTDGSNVYISLQQLDKSCYGRKQRDTFMAAKTTTSDKDITGYDWLFVDIDPERPKDTSSTDEQLEHAKKTANKVYGYLAKSGFEKPIVAMSGNGIHLLYKIGMKVDDEHKNVLKSCLEVLNMYFSDGHVKIDVVNFNPSRICKLYGTMAQKGANAPEQPHRMSRIIRVPEEIKITSMRYLEKLASQLPKVERPKDYNYRSASEFDIREWMSKHGLRYREASYSGGEKFILDCCPFDSNHKGKDAAIFRSRDGALGFHCFHNSCADKTWKDVRILFEPDAYEKKYVAEEKRVYKNYNRDALERTKIVPKENEPVFLTLKDIINKPKVEDTYIKTGVHKLDRLVRGLKKGGLILVSGLRGCGKSTLLSNWMVEAVNDGYNVACYSGELTDRNFASWMMQQAAGKPFVEPAQWENQYNVPRKWQELIAEWMDKHFWLYNNTYGNDFLGIMDALEKIIDEKKIDLLVFDNLMTFNLRGLSENKYDAQTEFVLRLSALAKSKNVCVCFIAHPRKSGGFLRLQDIAGTADLTNAVDFAFIAHRVDNDFKRLTNLEFGWQDGYDIYNATNVIEIAKDREFGNIDKFIPLWFERESRRMKNEITETKVYGWCDFAKDDSGFESVSEINEIPPWEEEDEI